MSNFKGAYSVLGMMVIGVTLASYQKIKIDWGFLIATHVEASDPPCCWSIDFYFITPVSIDTLAVIVMMLATPMAANTVVVANTLNVYPEKVAFL